MNIETFVKIPSKIKFRLDGILLQFLTLGAARFFKAIVELVGV